MFDRYYMSLTGHVSPNKMHDTDVPVVVISPEDREQVERLTRALPLDWNLEQSDDPDLFIESADGVQAALRSLIEPPKPEEPTGLGAVVEDNLGHLWIRTDSETPAWTPADAPVGRVAYSAIAAVRVLSDGVQP